MKRLSIFLIFCTIGSAFGQGKNKKADKAITLFTVNKHPVTTDEFSYLYKKNHQNKPEDFTKEKIEEYLALYVNFKLKVEEAKNQGLDTTKVFQKEFEQYREEIKKPFVTVGNDLDRLVKEAYERSIEQVRASHILLMVKPDATPSDTLAAWKKISDIRNRAIRGEDFGTLAKEFSEDPSGQATGGDLGYFSVFEMVYPFESAAFNTKVGDVSPIVKTRYGYHILKVTDHRPYEGEIEVSHIMTRTGMGDDAKARNTIFEIQDQLKAGGNWEELCKQYSEDPNTKNNGGRLRQFKMGAFAVAAPQFETAAFALQKSGDISDPIQTQYGWHIIRLEKKVAVPSFKEIQGTLTRRVSTNERMQISKDARLEEMKRSLQFTESTEVKSSALALADSSLQKGTWSYSKELPGTICSVGEEKIKPKAFLEYAKTNQAKNSQSPSSYMEQLYNKWVAHVLNIAEEKRLIQEKPEFKSMLDEYREGILLFTIMEKEVWNKASADSVGQQKFYQSHLNNYHAGDRVHVRIFSTLDPKISEAIKSKIKNGDTLTTQDMRKFKSVSSFRSYEKGESKVTDGIPWIIGVHETQLDGVYYLCEVDQLLPPGIKSFDDARANIVSDYQDNLEKEWLETLKKKYTVSINTKGKKIVIQELTAKK